MFRCNNTDCKYHLCDYYRQCIIGYSRHGEGKILWAFRRGRPTGIPFARFVAITSRPEFDVHIDLHAGKSDFTLYASDLTEEYVTFNKGDVTDPASLGG